MIIKTNCVLLKLLILYPIFLDAMDTASLNIETAHRLKQSQDIVTYTAVLKNKTRIKCTANKTSYTARVMPLDEYGYYTSPQESKQLYAKISAFCRQNHLDKKNR